MDKRLWIIVCMVFGIIVMTVFLIVNNKDETITPTAEEVEAEHDTHEKEVYTPNSGEDPFEENEKIDAESVSFSEPIEIPEAYLQNKNPKFRKASEPYLAYLATDDWLYLYNTETKEHLVLDDHVTDFTFSTDGNYVYYLEEHIKNLPTLNYYSLTDGVRHDIVALENSMPFALVESEGLLWYLLNEYNSDSDATENIIAKSYVTPSGQNQFGNDPKENRFPVIENLPFQSTQDPTNRPIATLNPSTKAIEVVKNNDSTVYQLIHKKGMTPIAELPIKNIQKILDYAISENGNRALALFDANNELQVLVNGKAMDTPIKPNAIRWVADNGLILVEASTMYYFNTETSESILLATDVSKFDTTKKGIYYTNNFGEMNFIQINSK